MWHHLNNFEGCRKTEREEIDFEISNDAEKSLQIAREMAKEVSAM